MGMICNEGRCGYVARGVTIRPPGRSNGYFFTQIFREIVTNRYKCMYVWINLIYLNPYQRMLVKPEIRSPSFHFG